MLGKIQGNTGNGYFSQAVSEYAKKMKPEEEKKESFSGKLIGECSGKEWDRLLQEADYSMEEYSMLRNGVVRSMRFGGNGSMTESNDNGQTEKLEIQDTISDEIKEEAIQKLVGKRNAPYSMLADANGMVTYEGVLFQCDFEKNQICLGDVSNPDKCLSIPLEKGGCLVVNRDNIDGLIQAIGMFSPKDINRIMQAIAKDAKMKEIELQIEDQTSGAPVLEKEGEDESEK